MAKKVGTTRLKAIDQAITSSLQARDWEGLEESLAAGLKYGASEDLRLKAALELGRYHAKRGHYVRAFSAFEHARILAPNDQEILSAELDLLSAFFEEYKLSSTHYDLVFLRGIILLIWLPTTTKKAPARATIRKRIAEIDLARKITEFLPRAPHRAESKATPLLVQIFNTFDPTLTPRERFDRAAKILAPYILKHVIERRQQSGSDAPGTAAPARKTRRRGRKRLSR
jgi:hypothetical protein